MKKYIIFILSFFILLLGTGYFYQEYALRRDLSSIPRNGDLIEVNGDLMYIDCKGEGSPSIILISGIGADTSTWDKVFVDLSSKTKVCRFDRRGIGFSHPSTRPVSIDEQRNDFFTLLDKKGIKGKKILIGHSAGGLYAQNYSQYDSNIVSLILLDSSAANPKLNDLLQKQYASNSNFSNTLKYLSVRFGFQRVYYWIQNKSLSFPMLHNLNHLNHHYIKSLQKEEMIYLDLMSQAQPSLKSLPIIIISRGKYPTVDGTDPQSIFLKDWYQTWPLAQRDLKKLSSNTTHIITKNSEHSIQIDEPELVIQSAIDMIKN